MVFNPPFPLPEREGFSVGKGSASLRSCVGSQQGGWVSTGQPFFGQIGNRKAQPRLVCLSISHFLLEIRRDC